MNKINSKDVLNSEKNIIKTQSENFDSIFLSSGKIYAGEALERAIPNLFDGLKQVQRRILYIILKDFYNSNFVKSAKVVGKVLGDLHPHGQSSIYGAIIKMIQWFYIRNPFLTGQGNFGSMDGNDWADMRYTELKNSPFLLQNIEEFNDKILKFEPNFDDTLTEPTKLPFVLPNVLLNGSQGIAFGYMSSFPPHNLKNVIDTLLLFIDKKIKQKEVDIEELINCIYAPDFPTGGIICKDSVSKCYKTGIGSVKIMSNYKFEADQQLIITEIPFLTKKTAIINDIYEKIQNNVFEHIVSIRDESDYKHQTRIVVLFRENSSKEEVLNELFTKTMFIQNFSFCSYFLVNRKPTLLNLKSMFSIFVEQKLEYYNNLIKYRIDLINNKIFKLKTILKIKKYINDIIKILKNAENINIIKTELKALEFNPEQIKVILETKLRTLIKTNISLINENLKKLQSQKEKNLSYCKDKTSLLKYYKTLVKNIEQKLNKNVETKSLLTRLTRAASPIELKYLIKPKLYSGQKRDVICFTSLGLIFRIAHSELDKIDNTKNIKKQGKKINYKDIFGSIVYSKIVFNWKKIVLLCKNGRLIHLDLNDIPLFEVSNTSRKFMLNITKFNIKINDVVTIFPLNQNKQFLYVVTKLGQVLKLSNTLSRRTNKIGSFKSQDEIIFAKWGNEGIMGIVMKNNKLLLRKTINITSRKNKHSLGLKLLTHQNDEIVDVDMIDIVEDSNEILENINVLLLYQNGYVTSINTKYLTFNKKRGSGRVISNKYNIKSILLTQKLSDNLLFTEYNKIIKINSDFFPKRKNKNSLGNKSNIAFFIK